MNWMIDHTPDLVITDYKLPGVDGLQFVEWLRSRPNSRQTPILMITISSDMFLPMRTRNAGATAFLRRPVDHQLVRARNHEAASETKPSTIGRGQCSIRHVHMITRLPLITHWLTILRARSDSEHEMTWNSIILQRLSSSTWAWRA